MKPLPECYPCLQRLIEQAATLATTDPARQAEARARATALLEARWGNGAIPARIATRFHEAIKQATGNPDPFLALKRDEMAFARQAAARLGLARPLTLRQAALLSVAGNALDFVRDHAVVGREVEGEVALAADDLACALEGLGEGDRVIVLADNAGEQYFDAPLLAVLTEAGCAVTYAVKERPVQNDLALTDLEPGVVPPRVAVITTGGAAVGVELASASAAFRRALDGASLVIAKGMGHYETSAELAGRRVLALLKAKCRPVAGSLGVPKGAFVARLLGREGE